jgi:hypothetical protein
MLLLAQIEFTTILFLAGLVLTCGVLLFRTHRQLSGRPKTDIPSPTTFSQPRLQATQAHRLDAPREARQWEVEMYDLARELRAELDNKVVILEQLVREATTQADRLEAAIRRATNIVDAGQQANVEAPLAENGRKASPRVDAGGVRPGSVASRRHAEIYALADQGLTSTSIATRVGSPIGEVELILGLRGKG